MVNWLKSNNIPCDENLRKADLLDIINRHKPQEKIFKIDQLLKSHGHYVLRLPPYMCDLSPIELVWAKIKQKLRQQNITGDLSLTKLESATVEAISEVSIEDWNAYCSHVEKLEKDYWKKDGILEDVMEQFVINVQDDSSDSDSADSSDQESDSSDLAQPLPDVTS